MFSYLVKYKNFKVKIQVTNKESIFDTALEAIRKVTNINNPSVLWVFDEQFQDYYILLDLTKAPDSALLKFEDPNNETTNDRFVK